MQRALLQYFLPQNHRLVVKGLKMAGRTDLIGTGPGCLVPPLREEPRSNAAVPKKGGKSARPAGRSGSRPAAVEKSNRRGKPAHNRKG